MTPDLLQVIEMDPPQLGVGEESFHHRDERQGKQSSFDRAVVLLVSRWSPSFPLSGYSVMSHIWSWALCVENHNRNTVFIKITSGKHYLSNHFSHAYGIHVPLRKMYKIVFWLMKTSN